MRIGFETSSLTSNKPTGVARFIHQIVPAIRNELDAGDDVSFLYKWSRRRYRQHWWRLAGVPIQVYHNAFWPIRKKLDMLHGLDGFVPNWKRCGKVVTIHDLAVIKLNSDTVCTPHFQSRKLRMHQSVREYADAIIASSETTKADVAEILDVAPEHIFVAHLGVDARYSPQEASAVRQVRTKYGLRRDYLLFVGTISGRKNTARLVEAFAQSRASGVVHLVLVGAIAYRGEDTLDAIRTHHVEDRVTILDYVADQDLPALYTGAKGFVFPTLYEGFGLPILEAMACGTPVLTSNVGAAAEISGPWAIQVDPYAADAIACGMDALLDAEQARTEGAMAHAKNFTWERCAKESLSVYAHVLER